MKILQKSFDFIINYSVWVALSVYCLTQITYYNFNIPTNQNLLFFVSFSTVIGYNFIKYYGRKTINIRFSFPNLLNGICLILSMFFFLKLKLHTQLSIGIPFLITLFYTTPFGTKSLRNISGLKIYTIAICWAFVTSFLPFIDYQWTLYADFYLELAQRFVFIIAITLPFEIRDLNTDPKHLHTIPQQSGIKTTKLYGILLLMIFLLLEFFKDTIAPQNITILPFIFLISLLFVVFSKKTQSKYYASFFVEGIPVIWLILWMVL